MKKYLFILLSAVTALQAQDTPTEKSTKDKLTFGGYGDIEFIQPLEGSVNGKADVHRAVFYVGYEFNDRLSLNSEIEIEHVKEIYLEQLYLNYHLNNKLSFRGGLMLVPMGIINETHESVTFNGVTRPNVDKYIVPSTWRELGVGVYGNLYDQNIKYQFYVMNGPLSYKGSAATLKGDSGFRKGRQKGAKAVVGSPSFSAKIEWEGISGLNIGLAGYYGKTASTKYNKPVKKIDKGVAEASVITIKMVGLDARYKNQAWQARGEVVYVNFDGVNQYNTLYKTSGDKLGQSMLGYYAEVGYDLLANKNKEDQLILFTRYESYNTHYTAKIKNKSYDRQDWVTGLNYIIDKSVALKLDYTMAMDATDADAKNILKVGIGYTF